MPRSAQPPAVEVVDVVDARDRPLAVLPLEEVHRQRLLHRSVLVLAYDAAGKVYLQRRSAAKALYPGRFDVSASGHVQAGEAREDAARRELAEELGLQVATLRELARLPASAQTAWEFVTLYSAGRFAQAPRPDPAELDGGIFVDAQELECLVNLFRDQLTPGLAHFFEAGLVFRDESGPDQPAPGEPLD